MGICLFSRILHTDLTYVALLSLGLSLWKIDSIVSVSACSLQPWDRRPSSLHIYFVHTGASIFTKSPYPIIFPVVLQLMWCDSGSTVIVYF